MYLIRRNIKTKRLSAKLDHIKLGPFKIEKQIGLVNYRLKLPQSIRKIHPTFYISLLEPAPENTKIDDQVEIASDTEDEYKVEDILDDKRSHGQYFYLVK